MVEVQASPPMETVREPGSLFVYGSNNGKGARNMRLECVGGSEHIATPVLVTMARGSSNAMEEASGSRRKRRQEGGERAGSSVVVNVVSVERRASDRPHDGWCEIAYNHDIRW